MERSDDKEDPQPTPMIPEAEISEILGLVEILIDKGGREDIYKLAHELQMELGETLKVIRSAEILKLVHTPGGDVVVEKLGEKISEASISERKELICEEIEKIPVFERITHFLKNKEDHEADRELLLEELAKLIPNENVEETFSSIVHWGRYAELFGYNDDSQTFYLDLEEETL
ncbi:MAG: ABC transporter ATP-binding protein [Bdellovibrionaceae bacterium]|nr:ABC transporter ATP-binding protein [Pseudobdellovibrionaceae bacterium]|tara:strand:- start:9826 stop:10347 length:522 start_codon:yes stop_codon:yes gene_type:complete